MRVSSTTREAEILDKVSGILNNLADFGGLFNWAEKSFPEPVAIRAYFVRLFNWTDNFSGIRRHSSRLWPLLN